MKQFFDFTDPQTVVVNYTSPDQIDEREVLDVLMAHTSMTAMQRRQHRDLVVETLADNCKMAAHDLSVTMMAPGDFEEIDNIVREK